MWDISIAAIVALVLALLSMGLWVNSRRQLRWLRREVSQAEQRQEIERIVMHPPSRPPNGRPAKGSTRHLRRVKVAAPIVAFGELIREHPGPVAALAGTVAALSILVPASAPHEPTPPPYASPEQAAPLTSPPPPAGDELIPPRRPDEPPVTSPSESAPTEVPPAPTAAPAPSSEPAATPGAPAAGASQQGEPSTGEEDQQEPPDEDDSGENGDDREDDPDRRAACLHVPPRPVTDVHACVAAVAELVNDAT